MKVSKSMLAAGTVTTFAVASLAGFGAVNAHGYNGSGNTEDRTVQRQEQREERLQSLVNSGTLSEDQRAALQEKHEEMHTLRDELKTQDLSREEMRERMQETREEFKNWAQEQGINLDELKPEGSEGRGHMSRKNHL